MADGLNKVMLIGHLGSDPELRVTSNNREVVNFSLATSESWKGDDGNRNQQTEWHKIVVWGKIAKVVKDNLNKGSQVYLEGKIKTRKWTDNENRDRYSTEIVANKVLFLGSKKPLSSSPYGNDSGSENSGGGSTPAYGGNPVSDNDIPF
jgi:single-strand DNA-binding protein